MRTTKYYKTYTVVCWRFLCFCKCVFRHTSYPFARIVRNWRWLFGDRMYHCREHMYARPWTAMHSSRTWYSREVTMLIYPAELKLEQFVFNYNCNWINSIRFYFTVMYSLSMYLFYYFRSYLGVWALDNGSIGFAAPNFCLWLIVEYSAAFHISWSCWWLIVVYAVGSL